MQDKELDNLGLPTGSFVSKATPPPPPPDGGAVNSKASRLMKWEW